MKPGRQKPVELQRQDFADGSTVVSRADGSTLILESNLAKVALFQESQPVNYTD